METQVIDLGSNAVAIPDLSVLALFIRADWVVKTVLLLLVAMSFWSWTIIFDKFIRLRRLNALANQFEESFWSGGSLDELYDRISGQPLDPMASVFAVAMREWRRASQRGLRDSGKFSLPQRIDRVMQVALGRELDQLEQRIGFLASTGAVAPFIGLFGTVWGIMNSFHAIGLSKNTSLATVAPGLAEALFATALGLVAAIPAVIAYNKISSDIDYYCKRLEAFAGEFSTILSRQLDERS